MTIKGRYAITTIMTTDEQFANDARAFSKSNGISHEKIYRRGYEEFIKHLAQSTLSKD